MGAVDRLSMSGLWMEWIVHGPGSGLKGKVRN